MFAVEAETGEKVWEYNTDGRIMSSPVVAGDTVYFGSNDGKVYAIENTVQQ
jgi:outer membrane protein assembly factor BamB